MQKELSALFVWRPPERLAADCKSWVARCRICALVAVRPARSPAQRAVRDWRPYARLQIDFMEVRPEADDGERYVFTVIEVATRYPFLRAMKTREFSAVGRVLFDEVQGYLFGRPIPADDFVDRLRARPESGGELEKLDEAD